MYKYMPSAPHLSHGHCPKCGAALLFEQEQTETVYRNDRTFPQMGHSHISLSNDTLLKYVKCVRCSYKEYYEPPGLAQQINQRFRLGHYANMPL
jgi:hypothetical protein